MGLRVRYDSESRVLCSPAFDHFRPVATGSFPAVKARGGAASWLGADLRAADPGGARGPSDLPLVAAYNFDNPI